MRRSMPRVGDDLRELKQHLSPVEQRIAQLMASEMSYDPSAATRLDRVPDRIERIEPRLEIVPAA